MNIFKIMAVLSCVMLLQGCIYKVVTVPVGIAYKTTKAVVKGTTVVVGAVIPDGDDDDEKKHDEDNKQDD